MPQEDLKDKNFQGEWYFLLHCLRLLSRYYWLPKYISLLTKVSSEFQTHTPTAQMDSSVGMAHSHLLLSLFKTELLLSAPTYSVVTSSLIKLERHQPAYQARNLGLNFRVIISCSFSLVSALTLRSVFVSTRNDRIYLDHLCSFSLFPNKV